MGKLYDDRGNLMSPSFSSKNGVRYRFYVSSALLRGRKTQVGSVGRVSALEIEEAVIAAVLERLGPRGEKSTDASDVAQYIQRVTIAHDQVRITLHQSDGPFNAEGKPTEVNIPWRGKSTAPAAAAQINGEVDAEPNEALVQSIVRAHAWLQSLRDGTHQSIDTLADANELHPKVVRQALRLAFLSPNLTAMILEGRHRADLSLTDVPKALALSWHEHQKLLD
jgi:hypothetical protein